VDKKLLVGVTGGIGSGKTTAVKLFERLGAGVVDTDAIAHGLTRPGGAAMEPILARFGRGCAQPDGSLDRAAMRALVFSDAQAKRDLEAILHPLIRSASSSAVLQARTPYVLLVVPLLVETGGYRDMLDRVLVIDCDESLQVERVRRRSGLSEEQIRAIMATQASRGERLRAADDVVRNDADEAALGEQVRALHARYLSLAGHGNL
jgi:dephospho-CoA kinase